MGRKATNEPRLAHGSGQLRQCRQFPPRAAAASDRTREAQRGRWRGRAVGQKGSRRGGADDSCRRLVHRVAAEAPQRKLKAKLRVPPSAGGALSQIDIPLSGP